MDIEWGSGEAHKFITNVGLITSDGPHGPDIMSCEWTHQISYSPGLIAVCIGHNKATAENIRKTKEFGVNLASLDQNIMSSVAGGYSGRNHDKIGALKELGFEFYRAKKIKALMVEGAALNVECRLIKEIDTGDHPVFIGEVLDVKAGKEPLAYHKGKHWVMNKTLEKPSDQEMEKISETVERFRKKS